MKSWRRRFIYIVQSDDVFREWGAKNLLYLGGKQYISIWRINFIKGRLSIDGSSKIKAIEVVVVYNWTDQRNLTNTSKRLIVNRSYAGFSLIKYEGRDLVAKACLGKNVNLWICVHKNLYSYPGKIWSIQVWIVLNERSKQRSVRDWKDKYSELRIVRKCDCISSTPILDIAGCEFWWLHIALTSRAL